MDRIISLVDYGYRADHEMTVVAKAVIKAFYSSDPQHSYWVGCSLGGMEALQEADRYPNDSQTFFGAMRELGGVEVPEPGADFYSPKEVPHGEVRIHWYRAKTTQRWERVFVLPLILLVQFVPFSRTIFPR